MSSCMDGDKQIRGGGFADAGEMLHPMHCRSDGLRSRGLQVDLFCELLCWGGLREEFEGAALTVAEGCG